MKQIAVIQTVGSITKYEKLSVVDHNVLPNTLVLRNSDPFPGYIFKDTGEGYHGIKLASIFIMLQYRYAPEKVLKISSLIKQHLQLDCNAGYGEITMKHNVYPCIRIKKLRYVTEVSRLQEFIKSHEFKLMRYQPVLQEGKIKVYKTFKLLEIDDEIYRDYYEREKFYIKMPVDINWETFQIINNRVKEKLENNNYDAAMGEICRFDGPVKVIRIFDHNRTLERAIEMKNLFKEEVNKEMIFN